MIVFASGEGVTDIGRSNPNYEDVKGPMMKLIEFNIKERGIECEFKVINREELKKCKPIILPCKKNKENKKYFFKNAYNLSNIVKKNPKYKTELLLVVLFRDSDTTDKKKWKDKYDSIKEGFKAGECEKGIPMLPRTSSEVWLLSSVLNSHKMNEENLEDIRDRDALKKELEGKIGNNNISDYNFIFSNISDEIKSYKQFKLDLDLVLNAS